MGKYNSDSPVHYRTLIEKQRMTMSELGAEEQRSHSTTVESKVHQPNQSTLPTTPPQKALATPSPSPNVEVPLSEETHKDGSLSQSIACQNPLTPPLTPEKHKRSPSSPKSQILENLAEASSGLSGLDIKVIDDQSSLPRPTQMAGRDDHCDLLLFHSDYIQHETLGHGAWSTVYRATQTPSTYTRLEGPAMLTVFPLTPPNSPPAKKAVENLLLAVKVPTRQDARPILEKEGRILTHVISKSQSADFVVPFHGFHVPTCALVMSEIPMNLDDLIKDRRSELQHLTTKHGRYDPILSSSVWLDLALHLVSGLDFLHDSSIIHGDIKPSNILVSSEVKGTHQTFKYLYCDFSSSRLIKPVNASPKSEILSPDDEITAVTTEYAAPELLTALRRSVLDPSATKVVATVAADVFALGVTLLIAATGYSPYDGAQPGFQKLSMAREGRPLDFARSGDMNQALRVRKNGLVDRCLEGSVRKDEPKRFSVNEWMDVLREVRAGDEAKVT